MNKQNGSTHFLFASTVTLDADAVAEGADVQPGGVLLLSAECIDGETIPAGTRIEFRCESRLREPCPCLGGEVFGVVLAA